MPLATCEEKLRLMFDYECRMLAYSRANGQTVVRILSQSEYRNIRAIAEKARHSFDDARDRLERHIAQHGC